MGGGKGNGVGEREGQDLVFLGTVAGVAVVIGIGSNNNLPHPFVVASTVHVVGERGMQCIANLEASKESPRKRVGGGRSGG